MSAVTASPPELATVYVRFLDEGVNLWRPVEARRIGQSTYRLAEAPVPADEVWSFHPGDVVVAEQRDGASGTSATPVAVARASDFDERPQRAYSLAG